jgi:hypothetical protein
MELSLEHIVAVLAVSVMGCIACLAFLASPYDVYFEDADEIEEI